MTIPVHWQARISSFWVEKIQNSTIGTIISAGAILFFSVIAGSLGSLIEIESVVSSLIGEFILGTCILLGGIVLFDFQTMRLYLAQLNFRKIWILSLFILAIPALVLPITSIEISKLDLLQVLVTGFWEETLYRGFVFVLWIKLFGIRSSLSVFLLLVVSSLIFGICHSNQGNELFIRSSLGFLLGVVTFYTGTILFATLLHAFYNGLTMIITHSPSPLFQIIVLSILCMVGLVIVLKDSREYRQSYISTSRT